MSVEVHRGIVLQSHGSWKATHRSGFDHFGLVDRSGRYSSACGTTGRTLTGVQWHGKTSVALEYMMHICSGPWGLLIESFHTASAYIFTSCAGPGTLNGTRVKAAPPATSASVSKEKLGESEVSKVTNCT